MVDEAVRQPRHSASYGLGREVSVAIGRAEQFACTASRRIADELGPDVSLCWGAATRDGQATTADELTAPAPPLTRHT